MASGSHITKVLESLLQQAFQDLANARAEVSQFTAGDELHQWSAGRRA